MKIGTYALEKLKKGSDKCECWSISNRKGC
jgi:hypothetical protein